MGVVAVVIVSLGLLNNSVFGFIVLDLVLSLPWYMNGLEEYSRIRPFYVERAIKS